MNTAPEYVLEQLFHKHFHHLVLAANRYVSDYAQAEELVQDVFVKVWQNMKQFKKVEDQKGYLFRAVKNSSMNFLRHVEVRRKMVNESSQSSATTVTIEPSAEDRMTANERAQRVHAAVDQLPENWKEAFVLSKYHKLKYHEIAEEMKISQKTVEKYISKSLQLLRTELKDLLLVLFLFLLKIFDQTIG